MKWYFKLYFLLFFISSLSIYYDFFYYINNFDIVFLFKIPLLGLFLIALVFHSLKLKIYLSTESLLLLFFGMFSLCYGLFINQNFNSALITHIYTMVMPIVSISLGEYFSKNFNDDAKKFICNIFDALFYLTVIALLMYYYFHYVTGTFGYYGFGTPMPIIAAFLLSQKKYLKFSIGLVLVVLSGKRSTLITTLLVLVFHLYSQFSFSFLIRSFFRPKRIILFFLIIAVTVAGFQYAKNKSYFKRFETTLNYDLKDQDRMFLASGGRWTELICIAKYFGNDKVKWILGEGMGGQYPCYSSFGSRNMELMHYAHFSPISYLFVYGLLFTILLYLSFFRNIFVSLIKFPSNYFFLAFIALFSASFFGSTLFIDPMSWFYLGILKYLLNHGAEHEKIDLSVPRGPRNQAAF